MKSLLKVIKIIGLSIVGLFTLIVVLGLAGFLDEETPEEEPKTEQVDAQTAEEAPEEEDEAEEEINIFSEVEVVDHRIGDIWEYNDQGGYYSLVTANTEQVLEVYGEDYPQNEDFQAELIDFMEDYEIPEAEDDREFYMYLVIDMGDGTAYRFTHIDSAFYFSYGEAEASDWGARYGYEFGTIKLEGHIENGEFIIEG